MKKTNFLISLLSFLFLISCSDAYDIQQDNEMLEQEAYVSIQDLRTGMNAAYAAYTPDAGGDVIQFNDLFTDNIVKGSSNAGQGSEEYNFLIQPNSDLPTQLWSNRYATINRINRVLRAYDQLYPTFSVDNQQYADHIKGNLLALRALCHLDLFQYFTVDYTALSGKSVIKMDFVPADYKEVYPRNTVSEILTFIKQDLNTALPLINNTPANTNIAAINTVNYLRKDAVRFIQCKVALLEKDYVTAQTLATSLLTSYPLANRTAYSAMFADTGIGESIFTLARVRGNNNVAGLFYFNTVGVSGSPYFQMSRQLYDLLPTNDVRYTVNVLPGSDAPSNTFLIGKYRGGSNGALSNNIKLFRSADLKLIIAECKARNLDYAGAATELQQLRTARYVAPFPALPVFTTVNQALTAILTERRKEFCFEGHRYLDLKRIGTEVNVGINRLSSDAATFSAPTSLPAGDYRFTMPIPTSEIFANPSIIQNPNY